MTRRFAKNLSRNLKKLRGGTSQMTYAKMLGISQASLNRMEQGEQNVTLSTLERLCDRLACRVGDLLEK